MLKAYKYRLYPNKQQEILIQKTFGCARFIYNKMLSDKIEYYKETGKMLYNTPAQYKKEFEWLKEVDSLALANAQLNLDKAYKNFFKNKSVGFPKFKSKKSNRFSYTTNNNNIYSIVIDYLNTKANTNYRHTTKGTQNLINTRLNEGYTVEDFKKVIDTKVDSWSNTEWEKYLRPTTLFGNKFENYLNENKKAPMAVGTQNKNNFDSSICKNESKNTEKIKFVNNF